MAHLTETTFGGYRTQELDRLVTIDKLTTRCKDIKSILETTFHGELACTGVRREHWERELALAKANLMLLGAKV